ncbi:MarR family transcriptional regulator [Streptomyces sp. 5-10]|uniref:MarR family transcriptional regulator n=1 Tax=Streptomyces sp. 5-10 TaxID=878925 RepID=UPI00168A739A|nr:MarR family transcriptional regulator [Streptomyces sp. 5-10]MBD3006421.1 MarR family transcriptional regulator [Streptomyces sp. 5-10]
MALAQVGLTTPPYLVLALLEPHPGISNSELARRSAVAAPTMLKILDALARAGYVERADRTPQLRTRGTTLTDSGRNRLAQSSATYEERVYGPWSGPPMRHRTCRAPVRRHISWCLPRPAVTCSASARASQ